MRSCEFCGACCDHLKANHEGHCNTAHHRILGIKGKAEGNDYNMQLVTHYNCNHAANQNKRWKIWNEKMFGDFYQNETSEKKKYIHEEFKKIIESERWRIAPTLNEAANCDFSKWYLE